MGKNEVIINPEREAGMMTTTGIQGVGKTYKNMEYIVDYVRDNPVTKVRGRKFLIFDTNGEYTKEQFAENGHKDFDVKRLKLGDVYEWSRSPNVIECRRIDAKQASIAQKKEALEYLLRHCVNSGVGLEDINTYVLNMTHMEEVVGRIVNLRHRACDVIISYQSLRAVEPRVFSNSRWFRMHYQNGSVDEIKDKVPNYELYKISELIVKERYHSGDERFFLVIHNFKNKVEGNFTTEEFNNACRRYLNLNKRLLKEEMELDGISREHATGKLTTQLTRQYLFKN